MVLAADAAAAQSAGGLPAYTPLNPVIAARSSLGFRPHVPHRDGWHVSFAVDYGSATELDVATPSSYVLDAEIFRTDVTVTRDIDASYFLLLQSGVLAAHAGVADGFFNTFHRAIGYDQWSRAHRPLNRFGYIIEIAGEQRVQHEPVPVALTDAVIGLGRRYGGHVQSILSLSLPTSTAPAGYGRGVPSISLVNTVLTPVRNRLEYEGSFGIGYTKAHGALRDAQRTTFFAASSGVRLQVWRGAALYGSLFYHSAVYDASTLPELERGERTIDFGAIVRRGGREWRIGLVEDTRATDGGIDLILRLSTVW